jgi:hypothetical protein
VVRAQHVCAVLLEREAERTSDAVGAAGDLCTQTVLGQA